MKNMLQVILRDKRMYIVHNTLLQGCILYIIIILYYIEDSQVVDNNYDIKGIYTTIEKDTWFICNNHMTSGLNNAFGDNYIHARVRITMEKRNSYLW